LTSRYSSAPSTSPMLTVGEGATVHCSTSYDPARQGEPATTAATSIHRVVFIPLPTRLD